MSVKSALHSVVSLVFAGLILVAGIGAATAQSAPSHSIALQTGADTLDLAQKDRLIDMVANLPPGASVTVIGFAAHGESARPAPGLAAARALDAAHTLASVAASQGVDVATSVEARLSETADAARVEFHVTGGAIPAQVAAR